MNPDNLFDSYKSDKPQRQFKIICVGDSQTGKTSLIQRYVTDTFAEHNTQTTMTCDFKTKMISLSGVGSDNMPYSRTSANSAINSIIDD